MKTAFERFWSKVSFPRGGVGCWLWMGGKITGGYGNFSAGRRMTGAHRVAWAMYRGEIPAGMELDHVRERGCTSRACVNPAHLEPVTRKENTRRGDAGLHLVWANRSKKACSRGHEYTELTTATNARGQRSCRVCKLTLERQRLGVKRPRKSALDVAFGALPTKERE